MKKNGVRAIGIGVIGTGSHGRQTQKFGGQATDCKERSGGARRIGRPAVLSTAGWWVAVLAFLLLGSGGLAQANVGRTVGTFQVNRMGAATYTIPIWTPRGPNGLEPHLALTYDSQSGSGYLGVGWALSGISSIYRCNRTYAQDGTPAPVALTTNDAFCLDGARLQVTSGSYGAAGSIYQTEVANFEQVTAYGTAGNGPAYFIVQAPNGTKYEYGNGGSSQVLASGTSTAMQWYLDKVTDSAGNTMTISYTTATGSAVPNTISWTPSSHGATTYDYTMQFAYGTNATASSLNGYVAGTNVTNTNLLQSITVNYGSTTVRKYALSYQPSPTTGRDELTSLEECADAAQTNCLAPTTFTYQNGQVGVSTSATTESPTMDDIMVHNDFTGDGLDDLTYCSGGSPNVIYVAFASSSGYGSPVDTGIPCTSPLYGDLTGNGKDGILVPNGTDWWYYTWNGSSFSGVSTGVAYDASAAYDLADVNGDGLPDLVEMVITSGVGLTIYTRLNTGAGSSVAFSSTNAVWYSYSNSHIYNAQLTSNTDGGAFGNLRQLDFNGDGRDDLSLAVQDVWSVFNPVTKGKTTYFYYAVSELISTATGFAATTIASKEQTTGMPYIFISFLNANSDACTDYLAGSTIYISGCNGTVPTTIALPSGTNPIGAMDWNGDGRTDILVQNGSTVGVYLLTGAGISSLQSTTIPYSASNIYFSFNADGDGLDDLGVYDTSSGTFSYYHHNGAGQPPDLLSSVTDGYGNWIKPTYVSIAQSLNSHYFTWNPIGYPYENYLGPLYIVSQVTYSDPSNPSSGTYIRYHFYAGAVMNLQGRGFSGFGSHLIDDMRNGVWETLGYVRTFPYTGMLSSVVATLNNSRSETIFSRSYSLSNTVLDSTQGNQRYFAYVSSATGKKYQIAGADAWALKSTTTASYSYDNYGNLTSASQTVTDNDSGSPYYGDSWTTAVSNTTDSDTSTWCLPLLTQTQVTYSDTLDNSSVTRTRQFTPDLTNCRYTQIVTAPNTSYQVTENLGYDSFGNINSDSVIGTGMTARTSTASWGATGQFPMSVTNAAGETTSFNYDFDCGRVSSKTDPNGLTTSWQYGEGFCRPTKETRPDGTYTTWAYSLYTGSSPIPRMRITKTARDASGGMINNVAELFDMAGRPYDVLTDLLDGSTTTLTVKSYDSLGRLVSEDEPYEGSPVGAVTFSYDVLNRLTEVQRPTSASDSTLATTTYQYSGDTTTVTDANGHTRTLVQDPNGWLRRTEDDLGYQVIYGYDAAGSRTNVTDNQGNTLWTGTWAYGIAPFLTGETKMDSGASGFTVDPLGERTAWTDPKGQHFSETYDELSRPLTRSEPDLFTEWTWGSSASSHNIGSLQAVCTGNGTNPTNCTSAPGESESWAYDSYGRLSQRNITLPTMGTYTYTWQYNSTTGFLQTLTYPAGESGQSLTLQYGYANGYLQSITDTLDSPNVVVWKADSMNPDGQITQDTLGNGIVTTRAFDAVTHFLTSVESGEGGGTAVQNMGFLYDAVGNVTQRQDNNLGMTEDFYYDGDDRLSYSTLNGTQNLSMTYNQMGDITNRSDVANNATWTYDPNHKHQVTEAGSTAYEYTYDANGNMTSRAGSSISWTSYNYPSAINDTTTGESVSFNYGPDRRPWLETTQDASGTTETYRLGTLMYMLVGANGPTDRDYIYAGSEPVAVDERTQTGNSFYYFQTDQQGSITAITNGSGQVAVNESFAAFGAIRNSATWSGSPSSTDLTTIAGITQHGYTFHRALAEQMGLNDMVGRVQDAITGRFLSLDPTTPNAADPQGWNPYSYVDNNPLTSVDPTGFDYQKDMEINGGFDWTTIYYDPSNCSYTCTPGASPDGGSGPSPSTQPQQFSPGNTTSAPQGNTPSTAIPGVTVTASALPAQSTSWWISSWSLFTASATPPAIGTGRPSAQPPQSNTPSTAIPGVTVTAPSPLQYITVTAGFLLGGMNYLTPFDEAFNGLAESTDVFGLLARASPEIGAGLLGYGVGTLINHMACGKTECSSVLGGLAFNMLHYPLPSLTPMFPMSPLFPAAPAISVVPMPSVQSGSGYSGGG